LKVTPVHVRNGVMKARTLDPSSIVSSRPSAPIVTRIARDAGGRREKTKQANRSAIIEAARQVFAELGYEATTVRDIIRRTELASGTFYNYFKSKEELYQALHDDGVQRFRPLLHAARQEAGIDVARFLELACTAYFIFLQESHPAGSALVSRDDITRVRFDTPESAALFNQLKAYLQDYEAAGQLPHTDVGLLTAASIGMAQEIGNYLLAGKVADAQAAAQFCTGLILKGVRGAGVGP
jgi:AcrR family transcriptional regulator